jgi:integrase
MFLSGIEDVYPGIDAVYRKGEWPKPNRRKPDPYSREDIKNLLRACETKDERLLVQLFLFCGGRRNEIKYLTKSDTQSRKNGKHETANEFRPSTEKPRGRRPYNPEDLSQYRFDAVRTGHT